MIVAPSFLTADMHRLEAEITSVSTAPWIHFDVMDGVFVPAVTYDFHLVQAVKRFSDRYFDCHLMCVAPETLFSDYAAAGADSITFHVEATSTVLAAIVKLRELGCAVGLSLKPATPVAVIEPYLDFLDLVLVMSVEPGKGGQKFLPSALDKITLLTALRQAGGYRYLIQVDGGINAETAALVQTAGADVVVVGSYLFNRKDREQAIRELEHGH